MISLLGCSGDLNCFCGKDPWPASSQHALFRMAANVGVPNWQPDFEAQPFPTSMFIAEGTLKIGLAARFFVDAACINS